MKKLLALAIVMAGAIACSDDDLPLGPNLQPDDQFIVGFPSSSATFSYFADEGPVQREVPIVLIGGNEGNPSDEPLVINWRVVPGTEPGGSTATEGLEYDLPDATGTISIPAGQNFTQFPVIINTGDLNADVSTRLVIELTQVSGDGNIVSYNNRLVTVNFVGCLADLEGNYNVSTLRESTGQVLNQTDQQIDEVDVNYFVTENTATLTPNQIAGPQGFNFEVLCGEITVPSQGLFQGAYPNNVVGVPFDSGEFAGLQGVVMSDNQFKIRYQVNYGGATGIVTVVSTYTRAD
ncbi:hypothetical protein [Flavobacterium selenitireducens]|uniref:hypothetical protein n=1 Tax=Flavobacterium selenitireducens TaxID=2722704 RepID=UPI00168AEC38|nr:hypothetical protein [Flavobacterium selenitireducens]MBD3583393.1 hypothetical protein [Flavobacterium selenitireducens]